MKTNGGVWFVQAVSIGRGSGAWAWAETARQGSVTHAKALSECRRNRGIHCLTAMRFMRLLA